MASATSGNVGSAVPDPPKAANLADPIDTYPMSMGEPLSTSDKVTSVILGKDDPVPDNLEDDDDDDDDIVTSRKRGGKSNGINGVDVEDEMDDEDDLFGDGADDEEGGQDEPR